MKQTKRAALVLLAAAMITVQFCVLSVNARQSDNGKTVVLAGSDFQGSTASESAKMMGKLLSSVKKNGGISSADGFLFCGDYSKTDRVLADNIQGVNQLKSSVSGFVPESGMVLAQGNHDCEIGSAGMSPSGNNDPASKKYGVFVINESDYMWQNNDRKRIIETSRKLEEYLDEKLEEKFSAPIFIMSHLQLHASMRTWSIGDGKYANYIFDVLNEAAEKGLNIVFLFGHNHGDGWDDYLGGASVYLEKGDEIVIAQGTMSSLVTETLNFYYLNAGYVGYYDNRNDGADSALTLTSFVFDDNTLEICRYDVNGIHTLKAKGVINSYMKEDKYSYYDVNTEVYPSPQIIELYQFEKDKQTEEQTTEPTTEQTVTETVTEAVGDTETDLVPQKSEGSLLSRILPTLAIVAVSTVALTGITVTVVLVLIRRKRR